MQPSYPTLNWGNSVLLCQTTTDVYLFPVIVMSRLSLEVLMEIENVYVDCSLVSRAPCWWKNALRTFVIL